MSSGHVSINAGRGFYVIGPQMGPKLRVPRASSTELTSSRAMPEITSRLSTALADRYRIERHLGEGGMATV